MYIADRKIRFPRIRFVLAVAAVVAVLPFIQSCKKGTEDLGKPKIMVSIEPLRYFTEQIAGGRYQVSSIVPEGYSPESYKPTPQQLMELGDCKCYIKVGQLGIETTWLEKAVQEQQTLKIIDTSDSLRTGSTGIQLSAFDPHTWTSAKNMRIICNTICTALCELDTANVSVYKANLQKTLSQISRTEVLIHKTLTNVPSRTFVTVHPSLSYFAEEYGLQQLCIETDGKEPTPANMEALIRTAKAGQVRVVLLQKQFSAAQAEIVARETGAKIVSINPLGYDWPAEMLKIAEAIRNGQ